MKFEFVEDRYVVKVSRLFRSAIVFIGSMEQAKEEAKKLNSQYQTDEYKVEKLDEKKFFK